MSEVKVITDYLERSAINFPNKIAFTDETKNITFSKLRDNSKSIASGLLQSVKKNTPIIVLSDQTVESIELFMGVLYTGGFYVPVDVETPADRLRGIIESLGTNIVLGKKQYVIDVRIIDKCEILHYEDLVKATINEVELQHRRKQAVEEDPAYAIFTSGSTGKLYRGNVRKV